MYEIISRRALENQTAGMASVAQLFSTVEGGDFRLSLYASSSSTTGSGSATLEVDYTDDSGFTFTTVSVGLSPGSTPVSLCHPFRMAPNSTVIYKSSTAGTVGDAKFNLYVVLERAE